MRKLLFACTAVFAIILSSCSLGLVNDMRGGHSPMLRLDGEWGVLKNVEVVNNSEVETNDADEVYFNATRDVGGYCEGNWVEMRNATLESDFLWSFNEEGNIFTMQLDGVNDIEWSVIEQTKNKFVIAREENGATYQMEFGR
jgi:hypothetical protein